MSGCLFISGRTGACVGRSAVRRISGCRREPLLLSDNFPALGYALDRDVIIGGSIGGIKLDGSLPQIIELDDRIPVKRRAIVGRVGSIFLFGVVCRRVKLRRGLITQWRYYAYVRRWCSGIRFGQRFSLFHGNGYDAAFEVRSPIARLVAVDQVDTCYLFDWIIQTIGDIIQIILIIDLSFSFCKFSFQIST